MLKYAKRLVPAALARRLQIIRDGGRLRHVETIPCNAEPLGRIDDLDLAAIFSNDDYAGDWQDMQPELADLGIHERAGGVNPGDRRAIHCLVRHLKPRTFLEVGTHIGASTIHIAAAMRRTHAKSDAAQIHLDTADIRDVNDERSKPWLRFGSMFAPREMIRKLGFDDFVTFHAQPAIPFMRDCGQKYDMIFLDGDHAAPAVYREVPAALACLRPGGYVLLHDFFPDEKLLWPRGSFAVGPAMATRRLIDEGVPIKTLPLGSLPWPTKLGTSITSLALLGKGSGVVS